MEDMITIVALELKDKKKQHMEVGKEYIVGKENC
jgi:hypothetical protein